MKETLRAEALRRGIALTEEQLDRILMYIDKIIKEDDEKKGGKQE